MTTTYTAEQVQALLAQQGQKHNPANAPFTSPHGGTGLFTQPGVDPRVVSGIVRPTTFLDALPMEPSVNQNEVISILTQQSATSGTNPADYCGDPVTPGDLFKCSITRLYGNMFVGSDRITVPDIGARLNRADVDRQIVNSAPMNTLMPDVLRNDNINFNSDAAYLLYSLGISMERSLSALDVTGNSTQTGGSAEAGWLREFDGLERIIVGTITDVSNESCPAAASLVETWNAAIGATVRNRRIGRMLHEMIYSRIELARKTGITGVQWALVMDSRLFFELVYELAAFYATVKTADVLDGYPIVRSVDSVENRANSMMSGQYLQIGDLRIPVLFTAGVETTGTTTLTSDLFFVPLRANIGPITKLQYFPMNNAYIAEWNGLTNTTGRQVMNNGVFMMAARSNGFCDQLIAAAKMRMICTAPFLAFRLDDIQYGGYVGYRDAFPGNGSFYSGGTSTFQ